MSSSSRTGFEAVCGSLLGLATITVGLRFFSRKKQRIPIKADDVFAAIALIMFIAAVICELRLVHLKLLGYSWKEILEALKGGAKTATRWALAWDVFATMASASIKLSAVFFYRRLFSVPGSSKKLFNMLSLATLAVVVFWAIVFAIAPFFQCGTHLSALWNGTRNKYCGSAKRYYLALVISNFVLDLWILALPIPSVLALHTSRSKKISIFGVFLLAFAGLGASIARMVIYIYVELGGTAYSKNHDMGLAQTRTAYLTMLELGISLVAVNLPSLWLLITSAVPENALRSIRSVLSLSSIRSRRSESAVRDASITKKTEVSTRLHGESATDLCPKVPDFPGDLEACNTEIYAMEKVQGSEHDSPRV